MTLFTNIQSCRCLGDAYGKKPQWKSNYSMLSLMLQSRTWRKPKIFYSENQLLELWRRASPHVQPFRHDGDRCVKAAAKLTSGKGKHDFRWRRLDKTYACLRSEFLLPNTPQIGISNLIFFSPLVMLSNGLMLSV